MRNAFFRGGDALICFGRIKTPLITPLPLSPPMWGQRFRCHTVCNTATKEFVTTPPPCIILLFSVTGKMATERQCKALWGQKKKKKHWLKLMKGIWIISSTFSCHNSMCISKKKKNGRFSVSDFVINVGWRFYFLCNDTLDERHRTGVVLAVALTAIKRNV